MTFTRAASTRILLERLVDYAGLFPPAGLRMSAAAANYAAYRQSGDAWALGRFVVPAARLDELSVTVAEGAGEPWALAVLVGEDAHAECVALDRFVEAHGSRFSADVIEARGSTAARIAELSSVFAGRTVYVEVPIETDPAPLLAEIRRHELRAKVRMGGVTTDAVPATAHVVAFLARCAEVDLPFKATAGLHHPFRGTHALTYEDGAPRAPMFGFVNVFVAAALARDGASRDVLAQVLDERDPAAFQFSDADVSWRGRPVGVARLARTRATHAISFGSCSFREPIDDLRELGLL